MQNKIIQIERFGDSDVLNFVDVAIPKPQPNEVLIKHESIGLNFIDIYFRSGLYPISLPSGLGCEGAGLVIACGSSVKKFSEGDRVAYCSPPPLDGYAQYRVIDSKYLVIIPDSINFETASAVMLKGLTSWYLLRETYPVQPGETIVVYAAAGGVGSLMVQWAKHLGVKVVGIVGNTDKAKRVIELGCDYVLISGQDLSDQVKELTSGKGVSVVYDSVGKDTLNDSLKMLSPRGLLVSFGNASGPVTNFSIGDLAKHGSLFLTRPTLWTYIADPESLDRGAAELFELIEREIINVTIGQRYQLAEAKTAHEDLQARKTHGCTVLIP